MKERSEVSTAPTAVLIDTLVLPEIVMAPVTYMVNDVQYVAVISGNSLSVFALEE